MCGRFTLSTEEASLGDELQPLEVAYHPGPRYNIAPTQPVATVLNTPQLKVVACTWGLVPSWARNPSMGARMINARAESLHAKPAFRTPLRRRRCLVLADGFYEWKPGGSGRRKIPYHIRLRSRRPFAFAGLWDLWAHGEDPPLRTCTIITTKPNELVAPIHDRMPVLLAPEDYAAWLAPDETEPEALRSLLSPYPAEKMEAVRVSSRVNRAAYDAPDCLEPESDDGWLL